MKKLLLSTLIICILVCIASCGTTQSLTNNSTSTSTTSDLFKASEQIGTALKFFYDQKNTNGKINFEDPTTYLQMAVVIQNAKIIKENYKDKTQYTALLEGLKKESNNLINENNADAVVDVLVNQLANSETGKKIQNNAESTKNWISNHQDTINAMNLLMETLKN